MLICKKLRIAVYVLVLGSVVLPAYAVDNAAA